MLGTPGSLKRKRKPKSTPNHQLQQQQGTPNLGSQQQGTLNQQSKPQGTPSHGSKQQGLPDRQPKQRGTPNHPVKQHGTPSHQLKQETPNHEPRQQEDRQTKVRRIHRVQDEQSAEYHNEFMTFQKEQKVKNIKLDLQNHKTFEKLTALDLQDHKTYKEIIAIRAQIQEESERISALDARADEHQKDLVDHCDDCINFVKEWFHREREKNQQKISVIEGEISGHDKQIIKFHNDIDGQNERLARFADNCGGHNSQLDEHDEKFTGHDFRHAGHDERLTGHDLRLVGHDERFARNDERIAGHDEKYAGHDQKFAEIFTWRLGQDQKCAKIEELCDKRDEQYDKREEQFDKAMELYGKLQERDEEQQKIIEALVNHVNHLDKNLADALKKNQANDEFIFKESLAHEAVLQDQKSRFVRLENQYNDVVAELDTIKEGRHEVYQDQTEVEEKLGNLYERHSDKLEKRFKKKVEKMNRKVQEQLQQQAAQFEAQDFQGKFKKLDETNTIMKGSITALQEQLVNVYSVGAMNKPQTTVSSSKVNVTRLETLEKQVGIYKSQIEQVQTQLEHSTKITEQITTLKEGLEQCQRRTTEQAESLRLRVGTLEEQSSRNTQDSHELLTGINTCQIELRNYFSKLFEPTSNDVRNPLKGHYTSLDATIDSLKKRLDGQKQDVEAMAKRLRDHDLMYITLRALIMDKTKQLPDQEEDKSENFAFPTSRTTRQGSNANYTTWNSSPTLMMAGSEFDQRAEGNPMPEVSNRLEPGINERSCDVQTALDQDPKQSISWSNPSPTLYDPCSRSFSTGISSAVDGTTYRTDSSLSSISSSILDGADGDSIANNSHEMSVTSVQEEDDSQLDQGSDENPTQEYDEENLEQESESALNLEIGCRWSPEEDRCVRDVINVHRNDERKASVGPWKRVRNEQPIIITSTDTAMENIAERQIPSVLETDTIRVEPRNSSHAVLQDLAQPPANSTNFEPADFRYHEQIPKDSGAGPTIQSFATNFMPHKESSEMPSTNLATAVADEIAEHCEEATVGWRPLDIGFWITDDNSS